MKDIVTVEIDATKLKGKMVAEVVSYLRNLADDIEEEYGQRPTPVGPQSSRDDPICSWCGK